MRRTVFVYVAKEMLIHFLVSFLFFFLIFFVNQLLLMAEDILSKRAPIGDVLLLIFYALPQIIATSAPFAALVGTLMGMGRLVTDREILAMSALGISIRSILAPVVAVGIAVSVVSFLTNDILLPAGTIQFNRVYRKILASTPALELESNSIKRNQNAIVVTGLIKGNRMDGLLVIDVDSQGNRRIISSPEAEVGKAPSAAALMTLKMKDAIVTVLDRQSKQDYDVIQAKDISYNVLVKNIASSYSGAISPREMSSVDLSREIRKKESEEDAKREGKGDEPDQEARRSKPSRTLNMYRLEYHKKFSVPFGAFFFVLIAFPLGLSAKTNGQSVGFMLGLIIAVVYWSLLVGGQTLSAKIGLNSTVMMWLPNAVVLAAAAIFMGRELTK